MANFTFHMILNIFWYVVYDFILYSIQIITENIVDF